VTGQPVIKRFTIINAKGLHARAAGQLVQLAGRFDCDILLANPAGESANAKSVMGVLLLCCSMGTAVEVRATGPQAEAAVDAIGDLIAHRFGEPE
jgi:phosphocarrier protein